MGVTIIHTAIGGQSHFVNSTHNSLTRSTGGLDQMTSADDFHLISWRNFAILASIAFAVLIPVGLRYFLSKNTSTVAGAFSPPVSPTLSARDGDGRDPDRLSLASDEFAGVPEGGITLGSPKAEGDGIGKSLFGLSAGNPLRSSNWKPGAVFSVEAEEEEDIIELETESSGSDGDRLLASGPPTHSNLK